jgi:hypothetical protein
MKQEASREIPLVNDAEMVLASFGRRWISPRQFNDRWIIFTLRKYTILLGLLPIEYCLRG